MMLKEQIGRFLYSEMSDSEVDEDFEPKVATPPVYYNLWVLELQGFHPLLPNKTHPKKNRSTPKLTGKNSKVVQLSLI